MTDPLRPETADWHRLHLVSYDAGCRTCRIVRAEDYARQRDPLTVSPPDLGDSPSYDTDDRSPVVIGFLLVALSGFLVGVLVMWAAR